MAGGGQRKFRDAAPIGAPGLPRRAAMRDLLSGVGTIMSKELRSRMRGRRAFVVLTVYLGILALLTYGVYIIVAPNARAQFRKRTTGSRTLP